MFDHKTLEYIGWQSNVTLPCRRRLTEDEATVLLQKANNALRVVAQGQSRLQQLISSKRKQEQQQRQQEKKAAQTVQLLVNVQHHLA